MSSASPTPVAAPSLEQNGPKPGLRLVGAALLSALLPGTGHLLMKRWSKGMFILLVYAAMFAACFWMPVLRTLPGAALTTLMLVGLCMLAASDAVYGGHRPENKPTQWLLAALLPGALLAGTAHAQLGMRVAGFRTLRALGTAMAPAIGEGNHLLVDSRYYRHKSPQRGDIIVFNAPRRSNLLLFKRVIAVGGDTLKTEGDKVYLNGVVLSEPYARFEGPGDSLLSVPPDTIPAGKLFVMGDNRHLSFDSRSFGLVDLSAVRGKVICALPFLGGHLKKFN
jgi:signal peptidase I